jgi:phosphatidylglycerophosphatase A
MNDKGNISDQRPPFLPMLIGSGFGSGFWPWGPGTAGSVLATVIWALLSLAFRDASRYELEFTVLVLALVFTWLGTWATARLQPYWGDDPSRVVVDEMVGVWIPLAALQTGDYVWALAALVLFRLFDIVKPFGIKALDRKKGAFWVMADDIVAGVYALAALVLLRVACALIG